MIFNQIESYGYCTSLYEVSLDKDYNVNEFVNTILSTRSNEWGKINKRKAIGFML